MLLRDINKPTLMFSRSFWFGFWSWFVFRLRLRLCLRNALCDITLVRYNEIGAKNSKWRTLQRTLKPWHLKIYKYKWFCVFIHIYWKYSRTNKLQLVNRYNILHVTNVFRVPTLIVWPYGQLIQFSSISTSNSDPKHLWIKQWPSSGTLRLCECDESLL